MTFSLRPLARSRRLRAVAVLAWLMLVINAVVAAPMGMDAAPPALSMHAPVAAAGTHCDHAAPVQPPHCCDDQADGHGAAYAYCGCLAMCVAVLPSAAVDLAATAITATYASAPVAAAPLLASAPPLRPPQI